jgi:sporulation protein YlmC with PRC-barrel domain
VDIPIGVNVRCAGSETPCGQSTYVILNPLTETITHVVVKQHAFPHSERLVPIEQVEDCSDGEICLRCTGEELADMQAFIETEFAREDIPYYYPDTTLMWPMVYPDVDPELLAVEHQQIPPGELAVRRGTEVQALDGRVGRVDEFMADPKTGHITHLIMREGHLWGEKDVTIPVSDIERIEEDTVHLNLHKKEIEALPTIRVHRSRWS